MNPDGTKGSYAPPEERRRAFADGQAVARQEHTAELMEAAVEAQKRGFAALMDGLDFVDKFDATDPMRARLIDAYRQGMLRLGAALGKAEGQPQGPATEAVNSPFFPNSTSSSLGSPGSSTPSTALDPAGQPPALPGPKKRGRKPGSKNKPRPEQ